MPEIEDRVDIGTAMRLLGKGPTPMATCPHDDEPLISTLEFPGVEFICVVCERGYGFLSPKPAEWTEAKQARHDELRAQYDAAREARRAEHLDPGGK